MKRIKEGWITVFKTSKKLKTFQTKHPTIEIVKLFPEQGEWTEADYFNLPETNHFVELSDGKLEIPDMPGTTHQKVVFKLAKIIDEFVSKNSLGEIGLAPLPTRLWEGKVREPDIIFMSSAHTDRISEDFWGVPDLVVEVLSKSNIRTDRKKKIVEYAKAGIPEYWIVDTIQKIVEVFALDRDTYVLFGKWGIGEIIHSKVLADLEISIDSVFN
jgi:Uma2 family endonuclease